MLQAIDGLEAIDYATRTRARLVILDYKMPRLDGICACAQIRRLPGYADMPIVILTAFDDDETRAAAQQRRRDCVLRQTIQANRPDRAACGRYSVASRLRRRVAEPVSLRLEAPAGAAHRCSASHQSSSEGRGC